MVMKLPRIRVFSHTLIKFWFLFLHGLFGSKLPNRCVWASRDVMYKCTRQPCSFLTSKIFCSVFHYFRWASYLAALLQLMERKQSPEDFLVTHRRTAGLLPPPSALPLQLSRPFSNYVHRCSTAQSNFFPRSPLSLPLHPRLLCQGLSCLSSPLQCRLSGSNSDTCFLKGTSDSAQVTHACHCQGTPVVVGTRWKVSGHGHTKAAALYLTS